MPLCFKHGQVYGEGCKCPICVKEKETAKNAKQPQPNPKQPDNK